MPVNLAEAASDGLQHVVARGDPAVAERQDLLEFTEREAGSPRRGNETQPLFVVRVVEPIAAFGARRLREQADLS